MNGPIERAIDRDVLSKKETTVNQSGTSTEKTVSEQNILLQLAINPVTPSGVNIINIGRKQHVIIVRERYIVTEWMG